MMDSAIRRYALIIVDLDHFNQARSGLSGYLSIERCLSIEY